MFSYDGEEEFFKRITGKTSITNFVAHLYSNERVPSRSDTISNFTEVNEGGYSAIEIEPTDWTITEVDGVTTMTAVVTFVFTSEVTQIYGYYLTNLAGTIYLDGQALPDAPISQGIGGGDEEITIVITLNS